MTMTIGKMKTKVATIDDVTDPLLHAAYTASMEIDFIVDELKRLRCSIANDVISPLLDQQRPAPAKRALPGARRPS